MNLQKVMQQRYATKAFDPTQRIDEATFAQIKALLRFSPSSVNSQPWHFIIADHLEARRRITQGTQGAFKANEAKILNASHCIVFCAKTNIDDAYLTHLLELEDQAGRFLSLEQKQTGQQVRAMFVNQHRFDLKDAQHWMEKQVYLNLGGVLLGAGSLGVDAVPIEGFDAQSLDQEFALREQGYTAVAILALGKREAEDHNATLPKSRRPEEEIFTLL